MPYYRITIIFNSKANPARGIKLIQTNNPDIALSMVQQKVYTKFRPALISKIEVVMLPKQSEEVRQFLKTIKNNQNIYL